MLEATPLGKVLRHRYRQATATLSEALAEWLLDRRYRRALKAWLRG